MKISLNWVKDYVKLPENIEISELAHDLTMSTVEVESTTDLSKTFDNIVIGVINEIISHPNADKLKICKTDIGGSTQEIVCGGTNLKSGMKVAVAKPGAMVRWHGAGELVKIKKSKLRGVESFGMICASSEIGLLDLFPYIEDGEIIDLSQFDVTSGTNLAVALGLDDIILEIDNKSLTNRPDLWGHYGIAREISAIYNLSLSEFLPFTPQTTQNLGIKIDNTSRCSRYIGVKIEGLSVKPSVFEIQSRLWRVGIRPINNIVDITNYVMIATGQPLHAFDSNSINGDITVRHANNSEKLALLDGRELLLSNEDLVISDDSGAVALAGIMGGAKNSVLPHTNSVILEIANFEPIGIRRSTVRHEIRTESSTRNEKGIDADRCATALSLSMKLFSEFFPHMVVTGFNDKYPKYIKKNEIDVSLDWLSDCLGKRISNNDISCILERLGFEVKFNGDNMHIVVPTWRSTGDVSIPNDIIEEIARMYGFENFEAKPLITSFENAINQPKIDIDRKIREYLAFRCGMNEIFTYPWVRNEYLKAVFQNNRDGMLSLSSPPSSAEQYLRSSLLPNLCKAVSKNLRFFNEFSIFEVAQVFFNKDFKQSYDPRESLPLQRKNMAGACVSASKNFNSLFKIAKGIIEHLPSYVHIEPVKFERIEKPIWSDDIIWLNIVQSEKRIGDLALLGKKASLDCGIKNSAVILFELDMGSLKIYESRTNKFEQLLEYPATEYDISLLFESSIKWQEIAKVINTKKNPENLLRNVTFVDEYKGNQVPEGKKSITFRLTIGSLSKTLTSAEIENYANAVVKRLNKTFGATLRS